VRSYHGKEDVRRANGQYQGGGPDQEGRWTTAEAEFLGAVLWLLIWAIFAGNTGNSATAVPGSSGRGSVFGLLVPFGTLQAGVFVSEIVDHPSRYDREHGPRRQRAAQYEHTRRNYFVAVDYRVHIRQSSAFDTGDFKTYPGRAAVPD